MRNPEIPMENAIKLWMYVGDVPCSASGSIAMMGNYHGGGSPIIESIAITTQYDIESHKNLVRRIASITK